jgi:general secretion pathway protein B
MSFILDALRKSEHARQHQKGPALAEVPIVTAKPRTNLWAAAAVALLVVNLVAVGVMMLRRAQRSGAAPATTAATAIIPTGPAASPVNTANGPAAARGSASAAAASPDAPASGPTLDASPRANATEAPVPPAPAPLSGAQNPLAAEVSDSAPGLDAGMARHAARVPEGPRAVTSRAPSRGGSVVYASVPEASDTPYSAPPPASAPPARTPPTATALPGADEIVARGGVPPLHLDLHVYSNVVGQRFIFVNSRKYKQGDTLQEGPVVEEITPDGAVLNLGGSRFKLSND